VSRLGSPIGKNRKTKRNPIGFNAFRSGEQNADGNQLKLHLGESNWKRWWKTKGRFLLFFQSKITKRKNKKKVSIFPKKTTEKKQNKTKAFPQKSKEKQAKNVKSPYWKNMLGLGQEEMPSSSRGRKENRQEEIPAVRNQSIGKGLVEMNERRSGERFATSTLTNPQRRTSEDILRNSANINEDKRASYMSPSPTPTKRVSSYSSFSNIKPVKEVNNEEEEFTDSESEKVAEKSNSGNFVWNWDNFLSPLTTGKEKEEISSSSNLKPALKNPPKRSTRVSWGYHPARSRTIFQQRAGKLRTAVEEKVVNLKGDFPNITMNLTAFNVLGTSAIILVIGSSAWKGWRWLSKKFDWKKLANLAKGREKLKANREAEARLLAKKKEASKGKKKK
jgi:hypothetical protein